ncbi:hypothetical protein JXB12_00485 [candidate division KSB1 bacterium]|nr:hypothetical protein [candidate division KSB1 bacterium]
MKLTPKEQIIEKNFKLGAITKDGFMGDDVRHVHDIIQHDAMTLEKLGISSGELAARMQFFIDLGKEAIENIVDWNEYTIQVIWSRGMLPCPFGEPRLHHKIFIELRNNKLNKSIRYTQLNVHLIREHGFFEGKGSPFRLEPEELVEVLSLDQ